MSNSHIVTHGAARETDSAALQLLLASKKSEGCRELEQQAWEEYAKAPTPRSLRTAAFVKLARERAEAEETLCRLQLEMVS